jgi:type VI secretion system secreted protein Hcp
MAIYMQFKGIKGNITAKGFTDGDGYVQLHSFSFGLGRGIASRNPGNLENREASTPSISEVSISKETDETSPLFFSQACLGDAVDTVIISFTITGPDQPLHYVDYTLSNVLISSYSVSGDGGDRSLYENMSLNFDKIEIKYTPYDDKHKAKSPVTSSYNLVTASKS